MHKHEVLTSEQLISFWLLYNRIEWAVTIEIVDCIPNLHPDLEDFLFRVKDKSIDLEKIDGNTLLITGAEKEMQDLYDNTPDENLFISLWRKGRKVNAE